MAAQNSGTGVSANWYNALEWMEATPVAAVIREGRWLYPGIEIMHILGFVILVGAAAMFDFRLLGMSKHLPVTGVARHLLRWSMASVLLVVPAGVLLFMTDAVATWDNPAFRVKMVLLALAGANALAFHLFVFKRVDDWNVGNVTPLTAKFSAVTSLLLWTGVISCGRLIAYI